MKWRGLVRSPRNCGELNLEFRRKRWACSLVHWKCRIFITNVEISLLKESVGTKLQATNVCCTLNQSTTCNCVDLSLTVTVTTSALCHRLTTPPALMLLSCDLFFDCSWARIARATNYCYQFEWHDDNFKVQRRLLCLLWYIWSHVWLFLCAVVILGVNYL